MKRAVLILAVPLLFACGRSSLDKELKELDATIGNRGDWYQVFEGQADRLRERLAFCGTDSLRWEYSNALKDHYFHNSLDSTDVYVQLMRRFAADPTQALLSELASIQILSQREVGLLAEERFNSIDTVGFAADPVRKKAWLRTAILLYTNLQRNPYDPGDAPRFSQKRDDYKRMYLQLDSVSVFGRKTEAQIMRRDNRMREALDVFLSIFSEEETLQEQATTAYNISVTYGLLNDDSARKEWLARSSILDFRACDRDYMSMYELATLLYEDGDLKRADRYIQVNLMDVIDGGFNTRIGKSGKAQMMIGSGTMQAEKKTRVIMAATLLFIVLLCIALVLLWLKSNRQGKVLARINAELSEANKIKDNYVFRYMALSVGYLERQDEYRTRLLQRIKEKGPESVVSMLRSPTESYEAYKEYYRIFDETFLGIYPDFIDKVNALLRPECRFDPGASKGLPTELRILAAIRLGITDSGRIASFLKCSPATVYTYRTKMRKSAVCPKDEFEARLRRI